MSTSQVRETAVEDHEARRARRTIEDRVTDRMVVPITLLLGVIGMVMLYLLRAATVDLEPRAGANLDFVTFLWVVGLAVIGGTRLATLVGRWYARRSS